MEATSKTLSIIAYYLSEYDMDAVHALGYRTRSEAIKSISVAAGRDNNYLKLRRDEFDALPESSSSRSGWRNRPPLKEVAEMGAHLRAFSFDELTDIVKSLIVGFCATSTTTSTTTANPITRSVKTDTISEEELEQIINFSDPDATIDIVTKSSSLRICNNAIVHKLKKLYKGQCQICGKKPFNDFNTDIGEAHHIEHYSKTQNNNANNIIIVCPNHHRLLHKINPAFDRENGQFIWKEKHIPIVLDFHLK